MKLVITYDVNVDALEKEYREYLAEREQKLEYYEETGDLLKKEMYEEIKPWVNFEEYIKMICFEDYSVGELENYELIDNCKMELKNEEEEA